MSEHVEDLLVQAVREALEQGELDEQSMEEREHQDTDNLTTT